MNEDRNQGGGDLKLRFELVLRRMRDAEARVLRPPQSASLLAVIKQVDDATALALTELGQVDLAENRVQALLARPPKLLARARLHLIGSLQANKARKAVRVAAEFHALESEPLLELLAAEAEASNRDFPVWIQVNVAREPQKHGCAPEAVDDLVRATLKCPRLPLRGLMTIAPLALEAASSRPHFRALAQISRRLLESGQLPASAGGLSMGMSNDFEIAVEEGATQVRVGSALFRDLA